MGKDTVGVNMERVAALNYCTPPEWEDGELCRAQLRPQQQFDIIENALIDASAALHLAHLLLLAARQCRLCARSPRQRAPPSG